MSLRTELAESFVVVPTLCEGCGVVADHEVTACDNSMGTEEKVSNLSKHVSKLQCLLRGLSGEEGSEKIKNEVQDLKIRLEAARKAEIEAKNQLFRYQTSDQNQFSQFSFPQTPFFGLGFIC